MAVPTVNSSNSGSETGNTTSHTVNLPASVAAGELLIVWMSFDGNPTVTWDNTSHGTWSNYIDTAGPSSACKLVIKAKVAAGTEGGGTLTIGTSASEQSVHRSVAIGTWEGTLAGGLNIPAAATGTTANPDPPAATDSWGSVDRKTIAIEGCDGARTVSSYPANYTLNQFSDASGGGAGCGLGSSGRNQTASASQNPGQYTISASDQWVAATISVRGGVAPVTGTFAQSLGALVLAAASTVAVGGASAQSLGALTDTGSGTVAIVGSATSSLGALTQVAGGAVDVSGASALSLDALTLSGTATTAQPPALGDLAVTLDAMTAAGQSGVLVGASAIDTLGALTATAQGGVGVAATTTATLGDVTAAAQGGVAVGATAGTVLDALTGTASAAVGVGAASSDQLEAMGVTGTGAITLVAVTTASLSDLTLIGTAQVGTPEEGGTLPRVVMRLSGLRIGI